MGPLCTFFTVTAASGGILVLRILTDVTKAAFFQHGRNISVPAEWWDRVLVYSGFRS